MNPTSHTKSHANSSHIQGVTHQLLHQAGQLPPAAPVLRSLPAPESHEIQATQTSAKISDIQIPPSSCQKSWFQKKKPRQDIYRLPVLITAIASWRPTKNNRFQEAPWFKSPRVRFCFEMSADHFRTTLRKFNTKSCGQGTGATEAPTGVAFAVRHRLRAWKKSIHLGPCGRGPTN